MLEAVNDDLGDDAEEMLEIVAESGFLLDTFDRGMSSCFRFLLEDKVDAADDDIDVKRLVDHYLDKTKFSTHPDQADIEIDVEDDFHIRTCGYVFKTLFMMVLSEAVANAKGKLIIKGEPPVLSLSCGQGFNELPVVFSIFTNMFERGGTRFSYTSDEISMRFDNENFDCR